MGTGEGGKALRTLFLSPNSVMDRWPHPLLIGSQAALHPTQSHLLMAQPTSLLGWGKWV